MSLFDILLAKKLGGGGSSVDVYPLTVNQNGVYDGSEYGEAYSPVTVNVPSIETCSVQIKDGNPTLTLPIKSGNSIQFLKQQFQAGSTNNVVKGTVIDFPSSGYIISGNASLYGGRLIISGNFTITCD